MIPEPIKKFVDAAAKLPGIGPRQATRLAFHLSNQGQAEIAELAQAVTGLGSLSVCPICFASTPNSGTCAICSSPSRRKDLIAIVEKETDLISVEKSKKFDGRYLVLGEIKKDGFLTNMQKMRLRTVRNVEEAILAVNPTTYGDINASLIQQELKETVKRITRLGRGIPTGGEIEFADEETLASALENRS